jgi:hypothetical protein
MRLFINNFSSLIKFAFFRLLVDAYGKMLQRYVCVLKTHCIEDYCNVMAVPGS